MTKKIAVTYTFLFLFVFTFALSFTLASKAQAEGGECCVISWCEPGVPEIVGHWKWFYKPYVHKECVCNGEWPNCDAIYQCGPVG